MRVRLLCLLFFFFFLVLLPFLTSAQEVTIHFSGRVLSREDQPLDHAKVQVQNQETGVVREAETGQDGKFLVSSLPVGVYLVTVSHADYLTIENITVNLDLGYATPLVVKMESEEAADQELVYLQRVPVAPARTRDAQRTSSATLIYPDTLQSLPLKGRSFLDFTYLAPQVILSSPADRALIAIGGQRGINTSIDLDGGDFNEPFFHGAMGQSEGRTPFSLSIEAIRQFQVVSDGASAEVGRMGGGYVNAITRSGTNDFHSSIFFYDRPQGLAAHDFLSTRVADFKTDQFGGYISGPLIKNKVFYFAAFDAQQDSRPVNFTWGGARPVTLSSANPHDAVLLSKGSVYTLPANARTFFARADCYLGARQSLQLRLNVSRFDSIAGSGTTASFESTAADQVNTLSFGGEWTFNFNNQWMSELRLNYTSDDLPRTVRSETPEVVISNVGSYGAYAYAREFSTHRYQVFEIMSWLRPSFQLKSGFDLNFTGVNEVFNPNIDGVYYFSSLDDYRKGKWSTYTQNFGLSGLTPSQSGTLDATEWEAALFAQMDWQFRDAWKLSAGLRLDHQDHPDFPIADFSNITASPLPLTARIPTDTSVSPRLGLTWNPAFDQARTLFRASAGEYVSRTPSVFLYQVYALNGARIGAFTFRATNPADVAAAAALGVLWGDGFDPASPAALMGAPSGSGAVSDVFSFSPDFKNPRTYRGYMGAERDFGHGLFLGLSGTYARTTNLERIADLNLGTPTPNAQGRLVFPAARPNTHYGRMASFTSDAKGRYWATTLSAAYRPQDTGFTAQFFYTYARERDDDSNERNYSYSGTQNPQRLLDEYSWSDRDRRHVLTGYTTYLEHFSGIRVGAKFQYLSAFPFSATNPSDLNRDGVRSNDRLPGTIRNDFRTGPIALVDLKLSRQFSIKPFTMTASLEIYNLFNQQNTYDNVLFTGTDAAPVVSTVETPLYTVNSTYFPTRQVQWGVRIEY